MSLLCFDKHIHKVTQTYNLTTKKHVLNLLFPVAKFKKPNIVKVHIRSQELILDIGTLTSLSNEAHKKYEAVRGFL